jgi:gliding motility-associated-like protein
VALNATAQDSYVFYAGATHRFTVSGDALTFTDWKIYTDGQMTTEATASEVSINQLSVTATDITILKEGTYFLVVKGEGMNGCTNTKAIVVIVQPNNFQLVDDHNISAMNVTAINASVFTNDFMLSLSASNTKALPLDNLAGQSDLTVSVTQQAQYGFVFIGIHDGNYSYTPDPGYAGHDSFTYTVERNGITMTSSVQFEVLGTNPSEQYAPVAFNDEVRAPAGKQIKSTVLNNDIDLNGDPLTVTTKPKSGPSHGKLELNSDGTYTYTPSTQGPGKDEFTYEVTDGHTPVTATVKLYLYDNTQKNNPPFGGDDLFMSFMKETQGSVAPNDLPVDGKQPLTYKLAYKDDNGPDHGMVELETDGSFSYVPNPGYIGADHFVYEVSDGTRQAYATAYVYVMADLVANAGNDTTVSGCYTYVADASGSQGLDLRYAWTSTKGTFDDPSAQVTNYTPGGPGQHELILTVTNGAGLSQSDTCVVTVLPAPEIVMDAPETIESGMNAILDASASTGSGPLTFNWNTNDGTIEGVTNEPTLGISSAGTYTLTIADTSGCMATQDVFVQAVEHAPVAYDDFAATSAQEPINIPVLTNDVDIDNDLDTSSVTILLNPGYGDVTVLPDGTINYVPTQPYQGKDQFTYQVCDLTNLCDSAIVFIDVSRGPFVIPEAFSPNQDGFNDTFEILGIEQYPGTQLSVYNRWQSKVYMSKDYKNDWDGKCNTGLMSGNSLLPVGTYYYVIMLGSTHKTYKGFVYIAY